MAQPTSVAHADDTQARTRHRHRGTKALAVALGILIAMSGGLAWYLLSLPDADTSSASAAPDVAATPSASPTDPTATISLIGYQPTGGPLPRFNLKQYRPMDRPTRSPYAEVVLGPTGLGLVSFGTPGKAAIDVLTQTLGTSEAPAARCPVGPGIAIAWDALEINIVSGVFVGWTYTGWDTNRRDFPRLLLDTSTGEHAIAGPFDQLVFSYVPQGSMTEESVDGRKFKVLSGGRPQARRPGLTLWIGSDELFGVGLTSGNVCNLPDADPTFSEWRDAST